MSPLHWEFHYPLPLSSNAVSNAHPRLSPGLSRPTNVTAYAPFTPSNSEQRSPPPYYRGCWHGVSRGFLSDRSEEHTSELQSLMRISYAVFCLKKHKNNNRKTITEHSTLHRH